MPPAKIKAIKPAAVRDGDLAAARRVLRHASDAIGALGTSLNVDFSRAIDVILAVEGRIIVSGMGKSGLIGRKIAATLASTGTPALFLHPAEASHGDLGMVTRADALLMLSNSGETAELTDLITYAKRLAIPLIGVANNSDSRLLQASDVALLLPRAQEACPMGLAPTTSTTMMLALGDALAVALLERKGFSSGDFQVLHPGGKLGQKLVRVADIMHDGDAVPLVGRITVMAEAILGQLGAGKFRAFSAGSQPKGRVHPEAARLLGSLGYDVAGFRSKSWSEFADPGASGGLAQLFGSHLRVGGDLLVPADDRLRFTHQLGERVDGAYFQRA